MSLTQSERNLAEAYEKCLGNPMSGASKWPDPVPTPAPSPEVVKLVEAMDDAAWEYGKGMTQFRLDRKQQAKAALLAEFSRLSTPQAQAPAPDWTDPGYRLTEADLDACCKAFWGNNLDGRASMEAAVRAFLAHNRATPKGTEPPARPVAGAQ